MRNKNLQPGQNEDALITKPALTAYVAATRRKFVGREKTVGASEVGNCIRKVFFDKNNKGGGSAFLDIPADENFEDGWGASSRGNHFEDYLWVPAMRAKYGDNLLFAGKKQKRFAIGTLSATPDALLINQPRGALKGFGIADIGPGRCFVIDCKTIDPRINLAEAKSEHEFQIQVQLGMFRALTDYQPKYGIVSYTNASFFDDVVEFAFEYDQKIFEQAQRRANRVMRTTDPHDLKPEGWIAGGKECDWCAFADSCRIMRGAVPKNEEVVKLPTQFIAEMSDLARVEREWDARASEAEKEQREIQHVIKERLREKKIRRIDQDGLKLTWSSVVGRPAYDMPKIKEAAAAAGVDLTSYERTGAPSDRLTITLAKPAKTGSK